MRKGYLLTEMMIAIAIAGIIATVFTTMNYYTHLQSNLLKRQNSKIILEVARSRLINLAADIDSDSYFELPKEGVSNALPLSIGTTTDGWGRAIFYSTIDLGGANGVDANYAQNTASISPNANIAARLVCSGEDGILTTNATHGTAQGDDILLEVGVGELNHFKLYSSSEITTQTRGYNSAIVSDTAPATPIDGTLWFDTINSKLKMYKTSTLEWVEI